MSYTHMTEQETCMIFDIMHGSSIYVHYQPIKVVHLKASALHGILSTTREGMVLFRRLEL